MLLEHPKNNVPQILQEVKTVRNLHGIRSSPPRRFSVLPAAIPAYYLHPRMLPKPSGEGVRAPVGQDVHKRATFEIHQDRPVAGSPAESEVIHAQYPGRLVISKLRRTNVVEQGLSRDHDPEVFEKTRSRFPSKGEGDVREPLIQTLGSPPVARSDTGQAFCEERSVTSRFLTEEPADAQADAYGNSLPGQVRQRPCVTRNGPYWIASCTPDRELRGPRASRQE